MIESSGGRFEDTALPFLDVVYDVGTWPPPRGAGNYAVIAGIDDGFGATAPVGSFRPDSSGIYDLGGNVWEWCEDLYDSSGTERVLRGASWDDSDRGYLLSSYRIHYPRGSRYHDYGFRCVLAPESAETR